MLVKVTGMDPSLTHWGLASVMLNLSTGIPTIPTLKLVEPKELEGKNIRVNSNDLHRAEQLATAVFEETKDSKVIFVEVPVGSQSARAMASYGVCIGILASLRSQGKQIIQVTATESKLALTGNRNATKQQMIDYAWENYPTANWDLDSKTGKPLKKSEHVADAIAAIHAGVHTPSFKQLMQLLEGLPK